MGLCGFFFYKNIKSSVIVNGSMSFFFYIYRSIIPVYVSCLCRSPCRINKKRNVKGITLFNKEYIISQYADDTDFILDGSRTSFEQTDNTLNLFSKLPGLKINYNKSEVIWFGSL